MLQASAKTSIIILLLMCSVTQHVHAQAKVYQYDGKLPFIQMMLNMMVAMGALDRLPNNARYGMQGSSPYAGNSFPGSPWAQGANNVGSLWGSPSWGVLPADSYTRNSNVANHGTINPGAGNYGAANSGGSAYWSQSELNGWVNEPWETSSWNSQAAAANVPQPQTVANQAMNNPAMQYRGSLPPTVQPRVSPQAVRPQSNNVPLVQNFNFIAPNEQGSKNTYQRGSSNRSPLAKLMPPRQAGVPPGIEVRPPVMRSEQRSGWQRPGQPLGHQQSRYPDQWQGQQPGQQLGQQLGQRSGQHQGQQFERPPPMAKNNFQHAPKKFKQAPCVTEFCGLKIPNLNGLWVTQDGEMLGVKNTRYLWSDGKSRYLTGQIKIQNEYLLTSVDDHKQLIRFKYKLAGDHLLTMQPDGVIREFARMSPGRYY